MSRPPKQGFFRESENLGKSPLVGARVLQTIEPSHQHPVPLIVTCRVQIRPTCFFFVLEDQPSDLPVMALVMAALSQLCLEDMQTACVYARHGINRCLASLLPVESIHEVMRSPGHDHESPSTQNSGRLIVDPTQPTASGEVEVDLGTETVGELARTMGYVQPSLTSSALPPFVLNLRISPNGASKVHRASLTYAGGVRHSADMLSVPRSSSPSAQTPRSPAHVQPSFAPHLSVTSSDAVTPSSAARQADVDVSATPSCRDFFQPTPIRTPPSRSSVTPSTAHLPLATSAQRMNVSEPAREHVPGPTTTSPDHLLTMPHSHTEANERESGASGGGNEPTAVTAVQEPSHALDPPSPPSLPTAALSIVEKQLAETIDDLLHETVSLDYLASQPLPLETSEAPPAPQLDSAPPPPPTPPSLSPAKPRKSAVKSPVSASSSASKSARFSRFEVRTSPRTSDPSSGPVKSASKIPRRDLQFSDQVDDVPRQLDDAFPHDDDAIGPHTSLSRTSLAFEDPAQDEDVGDLFAAASVLVDVIDAGERTLPQPAFQSVTSGGEVIRVSKLKIRGATVTAEPTKQFPSTDSPSPVPTPTTVDEDEEAALHRQLHKSAVVSHPLQSLPSRLESRTGSEVGGYSALTPQNTEIEVAALLSIITPDASVADSVDSDLVRLVKCLREGDGQARQAGVKALLALVEADPKRAHELRLPELFSVLAVMLRDTDHDPVAETVIRLVAAVMDTDCQRLLIDSGIINHLLSLFADDEASALFACRSLARLAVGRDEVLSSCCLFSAVRIVSNYFASCPPDGRAPAVALLAEFMRLDPSVASESLFTKALDHVTYVEDTAELTANCLSLLTVAAKIPAGMQILLQIGAQKTLPDKINGILLVGTGKTQIRALETLFALMSCGEETWRETFASSGTVRHMSGLLRDRESRSSAFALLVLRCLLYFARTPVGLRYCRSPALLASLGVVEREAHEHGDEEADDITRAIVQLYARVHDVE